MAAKSAEIPRKNADGYYRESFRFRGKKYTVRSKTLKGLYQKVAEKKRMLEAGELTPTENTMAAAWCCTWLEDYQKPRCGQGQYENYRANINNHIIPALGAKRLCDVQPADLQRIVNKQQTYSASHAQKIRYTLRAIFRQAQIEGLILASPAEHLTLPKAAQESTRRAITDEEERILLDVAETHSAGLWVKLMLFCGLRPAEAIVLRGRDIDLKNRRVSVTAALEAHTDRVKGPKSASGVRRVPIPVQLLPALKAAIPDDPDTPLFTQPTTGRMHTRTSMRCLWNSFKREMDIRAGAKLYRNKIIQHAIADDLVPYCLRHTYCTRLQEAGVPINIARELMGHSSIELTARIYTHKSELPIQQAEASINAFLEHRNHPKGQSGESGDPTSDPNRITNGHAV